MHKNLYIDADEEITSVIDKLRKTRSEEVIIIVPKAALILQSIVNLKLLKKEAEKSGRQIMVVTQDELGKVLVEKAGILVQDSFEETGEMEESEKQEEAPEVGIKINEKQQSDSRRKIGSDEFFDAESVKNEAAVPRRLHATKVKKENLLNKELVGSTKALRKKRPGGIKRRARAIDIVEDKKPRFDANSTDFAIPSARVSNIAGSKQIEAKLESDWENYDRASAAKESETQLSGMFGSESIKRNQEESRNRFIGRLGGLVGKNQISREKEKNIESFFESNRNEPDKNALGVSNILKKDEDESEESLPVSDSKAGRKAKRYFMIFVFIILGAAVVFGLVIYLPKATVSVFAKNKTYSMDLDVNESTSANQADSNKNLIPARLVTVEREISGQFQATGGSSVSDKKARGTVTIYNEYNDQPQILVATTRLLSEDNKLFRLVRQVTVPGMKDGQAGTVEADVIADQSGSDYNISAAKFSIPGFQGSPKFDKFYAKSDSSMNGGGSSGDTIKIITADDLDKAKESLKNNAADVTQADFKDQLQDGEMIVASAVENDITSFIPSQAAGSALEQFEVKAKVSSKALAFKESDLYGLIDSQLKDRYSLAEGINKDELQLNFGKVAQDLTKGEAMIPLGVDYKYVPPLSLNQMKKDLVGKSGSDVQSYFSNLKDIEKVEVSYWPIRIGNGRMPEWEKRIDIKVQ